MQRHTDFHPQDWLLIIEALSQWRLELRHVNRDRAERAAELADLIALEQGLDPVCCIEQIDQEWSGP
ncbi:hypothetical protein [Halapricum hydrolyticum]|uniref:Uncharacterized protein n=1 Tax=Halapricum hydrolyticum TaxID=2979991 RepID=A0AAE3IDW8_9EURY|nr:hypothetical protein [Halapricum hydrolyticum]MCU4719676.1 hypothetical protein [Halapricum hydrolyticum]MCU4728601.1 hypothetical protein [Halapricum hydrolyticum]